LHKFLHGRHKTNNGAAAWMRSVNRGLTREERVTVRYDKVKGENIHKLLL
jgi:hypothetical protein